MQYRKKGGRERKKKKLSFRKEKRRGGASPEGEEGGTPKPVTFARQFLSQQKGGVPVVLPRKKKWGRVPERESNSSNFRNRREKEQNACNSSSFPIRKKIVLMGKKRKGN